MRVHVYRNRADDKRPRSEMHFCIPCCGWYGVPHDNSHCQDRMTAVGRGVESCACRFCRELMHLPVQGNFGFFTVADRWQPSSPVGAVAADAVLAGDTTEAGG